MAKLRIEKTLIVLDEEEVRQFIRIARQKDAQEIQRYMLKVFIKKVEAVLRRKCG